MVIQPLQDRSPHLSTWSNGITFLHLIFSKLSIKDNPSTIASVPISLIILRTSSAVVGYFWHRTPAKNENYVRIHQISIIICDTVTDPLDKLHPFCVPGICIRDVYHLKPFISYSVRKKLCKGRADPDRSHEYDLCTLTKLIYKVPESCEDTSDTSVTIPITTRCIFLSHLHCLQVRLSPGDHRLRS